MNARPDEAIERALALVTEACDLLTATDDGNKDPRFRALLTDAVQVAGAARGDLAMILTDAKAVGE